MTSRLINAMILTNSDVRTRFVDCALALIAALLFTFHIAANVRDDQSPLVQHDFVQYYATAMLLARGQGAQAYVPDTFGAEQHRLRPQIGAPVQFMVPPAALPWMLPLALLSNRGATHVWTLLLSLSTLATVLVLKKSFNLNRTQTLLLAVLILLSGPYHSALRIGQDTMLLLLAWSLAIMFLKMERSWGAGAALSFLLLKPQLIIPMLVFLLGAKRYKVLGCFSFFAFTLFAASWALIGMQGYLNYFQHIARLTEAVTPLALPCCICITGQIATLFPHLGWHQIVLVVSIFQVPALILSYFLGRKFWDSPVWLEIGLVGAMPLGLATAVYFQHYDALIFVPSLVAAFKTRLASNLPIPYKVSALCLLAVYMNPFYHFIEEYNSKGGKFHILVWALLILSCGALFLLRQHASRFLASAEASP